MSNPKKQHYVPQVYLKHFTDDDGFIHIYDKEKDEFRRQTPANTGYSKHFYTVEVNGEKNYTIEKALALYVDTLYQPVMNKIINKETLTFEDKENLAVFVTFQYLRTPKQRKNYNRMVDDFYKRTSKIIFEMKKVHGLLKDLDPHEIDSLEDIVKNERFIVAVPNEQSLLLMLEFSKEMSAMLTCHNFIIIEASSKSEFVTSDHPYSMVKENWSPPWSGYGIVNTTKLFPLSPRYLLMLKDPGDKTMYYHLNKSQVRELNMTITSWSDRFLFSSNETLLRSLVEKIKKRVEARKKKRAD
jgi:hypothetical protein